MPVLVKTILVGIFVVFYATAQSICACEPLSHAELALDLAPANHTAHHDHSGQEITNQRELRSCEHCDDGIYKTTMAQAANVQHLAEPQLYKTRLHSIDAAINQPAMETGKSWRRLRQDYPPLLTPVTLKNRLLT